jgi:general secretion pathway protein G
VVVIVIAFFAALIIPGLISGPARARDAERKSDLRVIKASLENYYNEKGSYPPNLAELEKGATPFIKQLPKDPKTNADYVYIPSGNPPNSFVLQTTLENKSDSDLKNPGNNPATGLYQITSAN